MSNFTRRLESYPIPIIAFLYAFLQFKNKMENKEITRYYFTQLKVLDSSTTRCPRDSSEIPIFTMGDTSLLPPQTQIQKEIIDWTTDW